MNRSFLSDPVYYHAFWDPYICRRIIAYCSDRCTVFKCGVQCKLHMGKQLTEPESMHRRFLSRTIGFTVAALSPNAYYIGPNVTESNACECNAVVYSLVCACAACQGAKFVS